MAKSLRDQLVSKGLVNKHKAKVIKNDQVKGKKKDPNSKSIADEAKVLAQKTQKEQAERAKALNRQKNEQAQQRAVLAQIKQLIEVNRIQCHNGEVSYQFADGSKIKKLYVDELLQKQLTLGQVAIVRQEDSYAMVPRAVAEKVRQRDDSFVVVINEREANAVDEDDPYADFQIPDDLMW